MAQFDDGKDDGALRTIGEVSEALDIKPHVLRYWEQQFSLLKPLKRSGGRRYYRSSDIALVERIDRLVNHEGYTLKGAETVLRAEAKSEHDRRLSGERRSGDRRVDAADSAAPGNATERARRLAETLAGLKRVRDRLARALEA
ncbi:MerR HTH family regulatory protein [Erythrobacter litoralis]|jgi:DNA-binding transcriptional MerR regulator|uniref:Transcriptional regulator n=1 Tax=Erythrobacter litoralis TaxID=39960 RepID=A0A074N513_9SPHN|nr:MerR family transcriptional regulator [Erythrobacter litoralis]AOL23078.1 MerR HTH family regulatory protein [Erythrobacter litoralis]KEO93057.1 transcriptional regulator [Erythrobacter litoralis]MEE4339312.1 MerR family transcriptional regulator [Erythrobacter sp.]